ncbi:MAG: methanogenesis marker 2 protein [Theionarchaea archaeon]|nr:methanogenesis marker 2 protein [Theionarchaea archaeon]MBU7000476.1 methanogenesis marker 2 protein [Theionarchaea archaeon]MBU7019997.1 methanogenesis marker 2 protein [Theionarchaea archaeon]MBU7035248.1 methanogenesis marker 2 protein [Theionarchaea archaeon]MBU7040567.1 methanogenesis marker 2 protein [Theionarchaea archaeon]
MLNRLIKDIKEYEGLTRKKGVKHVVRLQESASWGGITCMLGDDAAVLPWEDYFLLLASDGIWWKLGGDPFWAGYCSVLVNVNDIYAMGGVPVAMVNVLSLSEEVGEELLQGIETACQKFKVPMVGGHVHPDAPTSIAVSILGKARKVLTSFDARPGDKVMLALDLKGKQYNPYLNWDSTSMKTSEEVLYRLEALPIIAEKELATSCKDVSNPGILGTLGMLLETSKVGAVVDVESIPTPVDIDMTTFVKMYPGYGFILTVHPIHVDEVTQLFKERGISVSIMGNISSERKLELHYKEEEGILFDFEKECICGF